MIITDVLSEFFDDSRYVILKEILKKTNPVITENVLNKRVPGQENYFGDYGYNSDGKKGKKQIVVCLLCDEEGDPVSVEVFHGNTQDQTTFSSQVKKAAERFGCRTVTFVGDRGMIKSTQIKELPEDFHYITAITKPQINKMIKEGVFQLNLFDSQLCEIKEGRIRYILRRNPVRQEELAATRQSKLDGIEEFVREKNTYLKEHPKASAEKAQRDVTAKIKKLKTEGWLTAEITGREIKLKPDMKTLEEEMALDGCYVIKTDLPEESADKKTVHDRYKDLTEVEPAFRT